MNVGVRSYGLAIAGFGVLMSSLYLFVKVRAAPAQPSPAALEGARLSRESQDLAPPPVASGDPWSSGGSPQARAEATRNQLVPGARVEPADSPVVNPPTIPPPSGDDSSNVDDDLKASDGMTLANKLFDRGEYEDAEKQALKMLETDPKSARMIRIVVSAACFMGDPDKAQKYYAQLTDERDKAQMAVRCGRYGVTFK